MLNQRWRSTILSSNRSAGARHCPAWLLAASASGQGKTTLVAALARHHRNQGRRVRVFKMGPDFLDPMILEQAAGTAVECLDLWMVGEAQSRHKLYQAAGSADLILIEGAMGLFDGDPSSAVLAERFGVPVAVLIDASGMGQTFGALALGLARYRTGLPVAGVIANRVASARHAELLAAGMPPEVTLLGTLPRVAEAQLPRRHLGLIQAVEIADLHQRIEAAAAALGDSALARLPAPVRFVAPPDLGAPPPLLRGCRIAVARDAAFSFIYPENLDLLRALGAELREFSPLADSGISADAIYLPGGYPELHLQRLASSQSMKSSLRDHARAGRPIYAECGGMLYLLESLTDGTGERGEMVGLLPGHACLMPRLAGLGLESLCLPRGELRGHTFHHSVMETSMRPLLRGRRRADGQAGESFFALGSVRATYLHLYFPSAPAAAASLFMP
ncbi:MAG: cobyrinate a,c-diamide synthase [Sphingobacteriia bacterium]|nr:cobyrinate a,c-diamide synthase [Sphingobacteriia bacterium]NCC39085.1 cobyrinate a,c-diamide synthase [Gammaproteobacteria bacterium]